MASANQNSKLLEYTTQIITAYSGSNTLKPSELPALIAEVYETLDKLGEPQSIKQPAANEKKPVRPTVVRAQEPAVPVNESVTPDYIVCLEDGKKLKMLKRHLKTNYDMTPEQYRKKWNLPADYPMVAPSYALRRSELAKKIGLGTSTSRRGKQKAA